MSLQFAVQMAVCFGKVARQDFPKMWPTLFEDLTRHMQSGGALANRRVYLVLHHVLKELATKRLATDQKHFAQVRSSCALLASPAHTATLACRPIKEALPAIQCPRMELLCFICRGCLGG